MKHHSVEETRDLLWPEGKPKCRGCRKHNLAHIVVDYSGELREEYECMDCGTITSANFNQIEGSRPHKKIRLKSRFSKESGNGRSKRNSLGQSRKGKGSRR